MWEGVVTEKVEEIFQDFPGWIEENQEQPHSKLPWSRRRFEPASLQIPVRNDMRSEVLTVLTLKSTIFWDVTACSSVEMFHTTRRHITKKIPCSYGAFEVP
jgi:hypothetical protein